MILATWMHAMAWLTLMICGCSKQRRLDVTVRQPANSTREAQGRQARCNNEAICTDQVFQTSFKTTSIHYLSEPAPRELEQLDAVLKASAASLLHHRLPARLTDGPQHGYPHR